MNTVINILSSVISIRLVQEICSIWDWGVIKSFRVRDTFVIPGFFCRVPRISLEEPVLELFVFNSLFSKF